MARTTRSGGIGSVLFACAVFAAEPGAGARDGPPDTSGRTLVMPNAIVVAPSTAWRWLYLGSVQQGSTFLDTFGCRRIVDDRDSGFQFAVSRLPVARVNEATMSAFVREVGQEVKSVKFSMARPVYEPSDIPFPGASYRFRYEAVNSFATVYAFGYFGHHHRIYVTQCFSLSATEPPEFLRFSSSIIARGSSERPEQGLVLLLAPIAIGIVMSIVRRRSADD